MEMEHPTKKIAARLARFIEDSREAVEEGDAENGPLGVTYYYNHPAWVFNTIEAAYGITDNDRRVANHHAYYEDPAEIEWMEWLGEATCEIERKLNAPSWLQGSPAYANSFAARY